MKTIIGALLVFAFLWSCSCSVSVRDSKVYQSELNFIEQVAVGQQSALLESWIQLHCECDSGKFISKTCQDSANIVQVMKARMPWHKEMMLYNGGVTEERPPKTPPTPAPAEDLCP